MGGLTAPSDGAAAGARPLTVGVLGCGLVSRSHLPVRRASPHARVDVVTDLDAQRAQGAAAEVDRWRLYDPALAGVDVGS